MPGPSRMALFPPPAETVADPVPTAEMMSLPLPVLSDQLPVPPTTIRSFPPPATTDPDPLAAMKVRSVVSPDSIISPAAPDPNTMAEPGFVMTSAA